MRYLFLLFLFLSFISCDTRHVTKGYTYLLTLPDGTVIQAENYSLNDEHINVVFCKPVKADIVKYVPNILFVTGYKQGCIDAMEGRSCYVKMLNDQGEVMYKDTCIIKPTPNF